MSPQKTVPSSAKDTSASLQRAGWKGYVASLIVTTLGLVMLAWACGRGAWLALDTREQVPKPGIATVILQGTSGLLTAVFGFAMLVQATPSIDVDTAPVWTLPEQRTFDDETSQSNGDN